MKESAYMTQTAWEFGANSGLVCFHEVCLHAY